MDPGEEFWLLETFWLQPQASENGGKNASKRRRERQERAGQGSIVRCVWAWGQLDYFQLVESLMLKIKVLGHWTKCLWLSKGGVPTRSLPPNSDLSLTSQVWFTWIQVEFTCINKAIKKVCLISESEHQNTIFYPWNKSPRWLFLCTSRPAMSNVSPSTHSAQHLFRGWLTRSFSCSNHKWTTWGVECECFLTALTDTTGHFLRSNIYFSQC